MSPAPGRSEMRAADWDARYSAAERVWSRGPNQFVAAELAGLPPGDALDLACGEGRNAIWLANHGWRVTAVDFSAVAVDRARGLARSAGGDLPVTWVVGDVLGVPLPEVDLALLAYLQVPPADRRAVVRRAFAALRPGGTLFLVAHDATNLTEGTGGPQDPEVLYTAGAVLDDLAGEPVAVARAERVARRVEGSPEHGGDTDRVAWDALVRLTRNAPEG